MTKGKTVKKSQLIIGLPILILTLLFAGEACLRDQDAPDSLSAKYYDFFPIGAAIGKSHLENYDTVLLKQQFSSITAENDMKPSQILGKDGNYDFSRGDRVVEFAIRNGKKVRGHTLVWYNQTRVWFYQDSTGTLLSKEESLGRLKEYITRVLHHYKGKVYCWDVVNEAIAWQQDKFYREDIDWFRVCGPEYIEKAFIYAREADPDVKLFYNDYNLIDTLKARKVYEMARDFQKRGIPIDGIGMQGHWTLEDNILENLEYSIDLFASLGLEVHITELDLSIYPFYHNIPREKLPSEIIPMTPEIEKQQAKKLQEVFSLLREKKDVVTSVTFWGVADNDTWLSNYFVKGRSDHPLLFDTAYRAKEAVYAISDFN